MRQWIKTVSLSSALTLALAALLPTVSQPAQAGQTYQRPSANRYSVNTTRRTIARPVRYQRWASAPRGSRVVYGRYWNPRTRWAVDPRTHVSFAVLPGDEIWFLDPTSGWGYTVDRYGRVYSSNPRSSLIYSLGYYGSWRGDLPYFFSYFSPYDGWYSVPRYDYFYNYYYTPRRSWYSYDYAYNSLWGFNSWYSSPTFVNVTVFNYYAPTVVRYDQQYYQDRYVAPQAVPQYSQVVNDRVQSYGNAGTPGAFTPVSTIDTVLLQDKTPDVRVDIAPAVETPIAVDLSSVVVDSTALAPTADIPVEVQAPAELTRDTPALEVADAPEPFKQELPTQEVVDTQPMNNGDTALEVGEPQPVKESMADQTPINNASDIEQADRGGMDQSPAQPAPDMDQVQVKDPEPTYESPAQEQPQYNAPEASDREPAYEEAPVRDEPQYETPVQDEYKQSEPQYEAPQQQEYSAPEPQYEAPQQQEYSAPEPQYEAPQQQEYSAPEPQYEAPQQQEYSAPEPQYRAPEPKYEAPARNDDNDIGAKDDGGGQQASNGALFDRALAGKDKEQDNDDKQDSDNDKGNYKSDEESDGGGNFA
jgi:hypothetical protein